MIPVNLEYNLVLLGEGLDGRQKLFFRVNFIAEHLRGYTRRHANGWVVTTAERNIDNVSLDTGFKTISLGSARPNIQFPRFAIAGILREQSISETRVLRMLGAAPVGPEEDRMALSTRIIHEIHEAIAGFVHYANEASCPPPDLVHPIVHESLLTAFASSVDVEEEDEDETPAPACVEEFFPGKVIL